MSARDRFKRTKSINYKCSLLAMVLSQAALFTFNMSLIANVAAYILNSLVWIAVGGVLEAVCATYYGVDLTKRDAR